MCNEDILAHAGLSPALSLVIKRREAIFGHIARLWDDTFAHSPLQCQVDQSLGRLPTCQVLEKETWLSMQQMAGSTP